MFRIFLIVFFTVSSARATDAATVYFDGKYFNNNLNDTSRWVHWETSDPILSLGRQNINSENKNLKLRVKIKNNTLVGQNIPVSQTCYGDIIIQRETDSKGRSISNLAPNEETEITLHFSPRQAGNKLCSFSVGAQKFNFRGLAEDKGGF